MKIHLSIVALALIGCAGDSKQDISNAPFSIDEVDSKEDSPTKPSKGVDMRVTELTQDHFTKNRGWIAHQIQLTGGRVDIDLTGTEFNEPLDTILYVFGPRKPNGKYPTNPIGFNDDYEPGVNLGSHIVLDVPTDGIYQVVVSTYENYIRFPRNVSRGEYRLMVKCQDPNHGACGPAVSGVDGQCWSDSECVANDGTPLHCEGEVTCAPGTQCFFVRIGVCVADYAYMTIKPKQCNSNPWSNAVVGEDETAFPIGDLAKIKKFYGSLGVTFEQLGQLTPPEPAITCSGCACPRGDEIIVKVKSESAQILAGNGWTFSAPAIGAMSTEPIACGNNPWQDQTSTTIDQELEQIDTWLANENASVTKRGFMYSAEPRTVCKACSCPRGDYLVAFPVDDPAHGMLSSLGFADIYVP